MSIINLNTIFRRDDLRGIWPGDFNSETAYLAGRAFCRLLREHGVPLDRCRIAVGYDARLGSADLAVALIQGFQHEQGQSVLLGMVSVEQIYFVCGHHAGEFAGGVMITASHNPANYNGMKFVFSGALPLTLGDLGRLRSFMEEMALEPETMDISEEFADYMLSCSDLNPEKMHRSEPVKIVIGAGNGVGGVAFSSLAARLEKQGFVFEYLDCNPDGHFPHGVPNPMLKGYMERLGKAVIACGADLGVGFDGDADRAGFVDNTGKEVNPAHVFALVALRKLVSGSRKKGDGRPVVMRNICCSRLIQDLFPAGGNVELVDTPVGHGRIKQLMRHPDFAGRVVFAGEHSGHYFYPEFYSVDSGILTALNLMAVVCDLKASGGNLGEELMVWRKNYRWSGELNYVVPSMEDVNPILKELWRETRAIPGAVRLEVRQDEKLGLERVFVSDDEYFPEKAAVPDLKMQWDEGVCGWWFVVRPSGNEPILRLNIECWGRSAGSMCIEKQDWLEAFLSRRGAVRADS